MTKQAESRSSGGSLQQPADKVTSMDALTPYRSRRPSMSGRNITVTKRGQAIQQSYDAADTTPIPTSKTPKEKTTRSSEKETPTVVGTQGVLFGDVASIRSQGTRNTTTSRDTSASSNSSQDEDESLQTKAAQMLQVTLECGIASICRLRKLFPSSFFSKFDLDGTSVTNFAMKELKRVLIESEHEVEKESTMSPLTATQKTHNTQYTQRRAKGDEGRGTVVGGGGRMAAEALILIRWIGDGGAKVLMRQNKLSRVIFGIMLPNSDEEEDDELLEQYVFQFGQTQPTQPSQNLALSQAHRDMASFFQHLNGYSAGNGRLSQAVVPMMTQGTADTCTQASACSQFDYLATQQTERDDEESLTSGYSRRSLYDSQKSYSQYVTSKSKQSRSQKASLSIASKSERSRYSRASQSVASMSQKSIVEKMTQSIKASAKRNRGVRIPPERYLTLRIEFTESLSSSELPEMLRSEKASTVSPKPQTKGMVITPLGTVAEDNCTGLSVAMTAYSKAAISNDRHSQKSDSQFMIDELIVEKRRFKPFTQMDLEDNDEIASKSSKSKSTTSRTGTKASSKRKTVAEKPSSIKKSRCVSPLEQRILPPHSKAFAVPFIGNNGTFLKCIVLDRRLSSEGEQYKVEFTSNALERKKQWIFSRNVVNADDMSKRIRSALQNHDCDDHEELIEAVADKLCVGAAYVGAILSRMSGM